MQPLLTLTGGAGRIGTAIAPMLRERFRLRIVDVRSPATSEANDDVVIGDLSEMSVAERALVGATAVVHLAGNPSTAASWDEVRSANIEGTFNVFEAARRHDVGKIVFASTNHVVGFYQLEQQFPIDTRVPVRPDSLYGVSKEFGEALGRYYSDAFGISVICLRIGWYTTGLPNSAGLNQLWISTQDMAQVVLRSLETPRRFGIYNATSDNPSHNWDLGATREELGYAPVDDVTRVAVPGEGAPYVEPSAGVLRST